MIIEIPKKQFGSIDFLPSSVTVLFVYLFLNVRTPSPSNQTKTYKST